MKEITLNGVAYDFLIENGVIAIKDILNFHEHLMRNIK